MKKLITIAFLVFTVNTFGQSTTYTIKDLIEFSKSQYGFIRSDKTINEYYGDFNCTNVQKSIFDFNVGCGKCGDIISVIIRENPNKKNNFELIFVDDNKKIGELDIINQNKIQGNIKLCLDKGQCCCGEEGEIFILTKLK